MKNMDCQLLRQNLVKKSQQRKHKYWCFCCLQDKTWIKVPKQTIFLEKQVFLFTENLWRNLWRNNWQSIFDVVERLSLWHFYLFFVFSKSRVNRCRIFVLKSPNLEGASKCISQLLTHSWDPNHQNFVDHEIFF